MKYLISAVALFLSSTVALAQEKCNVLLLDGTRLHGVLAEESVEVETKYGKLTLPWKEVSSVKLGLHFPDGAKEEIDAALKDLGSEEFKKRDAATNKLISLGRISYLPVSDHLKTKPELEAQRRGEQIMEAINNKIPKDEVRTTGFDLITANDGTIKGRLVKKTIKLKTVHLGELDLKLSSIDSLYSGSERMLKVDGSKYGLQQAEWLDTGVVITKQQKLVITATGQVDMWPQTPGQNMASPKGLPNNTWHNGKPAGALIGKIGDGPEFVVGDSYNGVADQSGKLFLRINGHPWGNTGAPLGEFEAKVEAKY